MKKNERSETRITVKEAGRPMTEQELDLDSDPEFIADGCKSATVEDILRALKDQGMSQSDLARALGKSRQYVNQILKEEINLTIETLASIAAAFRRQLVLRMIRQ